jgi:hypothetical protein
MRRAALAALVALAAAACGAGGGSDDGDDTNVDGNTGDAPQFCAAEATFDPSMPTTLDTRVRAYGFAVNAVGAVGYVWRVYYQGAELPLTQEAPGDQSVSFAVVGPGPYDVFLDVTSDVPCQGYVGAVNVRDPAANETAWRLRFVPRAGTAAPPQEVVRLVPGGADFDLGTIVLDAGTPVSATVRDGAGTGIAAYLRFVSPANPALAVEAYADATGALATIAPSGQSDVLVVPADPALAPARIAGWLPGTPLVADAGTGVTGTVLDPAGQPLAGARVALEVGGVPSTVATTAADGTYALRARPGGPVAITVAPPDASGLPRLVATASALATTIDVAYASGLATRDLAGTVLRRAGVAAPMAHVTFLGAIATAGTITVGGSPVPAAGDVVIAADALGSGALPTTRVPARALTAVLVPVPGEAAVIAADFTTGAPAALDAPAMAALTARVVGPGGATEPVAGARLIAIPRGDLALGQATPRSAIAATDGMVTLTVAPGGTYDLVIDDPARIRARRWLPAVGAGALGTIALDPAHRILGALREPGGAIAASSTAVEAFCTGCSGIDAQRPAGESATNLAGEFALAVRDPGIATVLAAPAPRPAPPRPARSAPRRARR